MSKLFHDARRFNGDIAKWDVSSVKNMHGMFLDAEGFGSDISNWDVSSVANMYRMFYQAALFNGDISKWDVLSVTNMQKMFFNAQSFTQTLCGAWSISSAAKVDMFHGSSGDLCFGRFHVPRPSVP